MGVNATSGDPRKAKNPLLSGVYASGGWTILDSNNGEPESHLRPCQQEPYVPYASGSNPQGAAKSAAVQYPHGPSSALHAATGLAELADLWPNLTADDQQALVDHAHTLAAMRQTAPLDKPDGLSSLGATVPA